MHSCLGQVSAFFHRPIFNTSFMTKMHFIQMTLVIIMIILTGARVGIKPSGMPVTRSDTLGIVMVARTSRAALLYTKATY